jgi:hypothetical protein
MFLRFKKVIDSGQKAIITNRIADFADGGMELMGGRDH